MSRWIDADALNIYDVSPVDGFVVMGVTEEDVDLAPSIDLVRCAECRKVREDGGHANCGGYLYCRKWKTLVDEDSYCSWGEREGE